MLLANIAQHTDLEVVLLFTRHDDTVPTYLANKYGAQCFVYTDTREDKRYIPSVRPWLLWKYLRADPAREQEQYFYIDSDVIFREWPLLGKLGADASHWIGSDCSHYIGLEYILSCTNGQEIAENMARIAGITVDQMRGVSGIGAHMVLTKPTAEFWHDVYEQCLELYTYFNTVDSNIQKWTAEMWAQLWSMVRVGIIPTASKELEFAMATDDISRWDEVKILHNAGVVDQTDLFFKGKWDTETPLGQTHDYVNQNKCSYRYVQAIQNVVL